MKPYLQRRSTALVKLCAWALILATGNAWASGSEAFGAFLLFGLPISLVLTMLAVRWLARRLWVRLVLSLPIVLLLCFVSAQIIEWSLKPEYDWWVEETPYFGSSILNVVLEPNPISTNSRYASKSSANTLTVNVGLSSGFHTEDRTYAVTIICREAWIQVSNATYKPSGGNCADEGSVGMSGEKVSLVFSTPNGLSNRFDLHLPVSNSSAVMRSETTTYVKRKQ